MKLGMLAVLSLVLVTAALGSLSVGSAPVSLHELVSGDAAARYVFGSVRAPRTLLAASTGAALATSGAALQGLFKNPLVDPSLIGVSQGAGLAAACTIVLGDLLPASLASASFWLLPVAAFGGALATVIITWKLGTREGRTGIAALLLVGVGIGAIASAGTGALTVVASDAELRDVTFWMLGSLNGASWQRVAIVVPLALTGVLVLPRAASALNALSMGDAVAEHLGVRVQRVKRIVVVFSALSVGVTVAVTGVIGFIGLVAPHVVRLIRGPDHRLLLPASALAGATLLLAADLVARVVIAPAEAPVGIVLALVGGPFFLWLVVRAETPGGALG